MRQKEEWLDKILRESGQDQCIVFVNTKRMCNLVQLNSSAETMLTLADMVGYIQQNHDVLAKGRLQDTEVRSKARRLTQE